jgi:hypothetical protein
MQPPSKEAEMTLRYKDLKGKKYELLDLTSLTEEEFELLVVPFEQHFQAHMVQWRIDGQPRQERRYTTYKNSPLPSAEDRLLFIMVYVKTHSLQVVHGRLFGLPQCKANTWIHLLLGILQTTLQALGDAPSRSLADLAQRLDVSTQQAVDLLTGEQTNVEEKAAVEQPSPLFVMTAPNEPSHAPRMRLNRKAHSVARKSATRSRISY